jgi:hypothetical protein
VSDACLVGMIFGVGVCLVSVIVDRILRCWNRRGTPRSLSLIVWPIGGAVCGCVSGLIGKMSHCRLRDFGDSVSPGGTCGLLGSLPRYLPRALWIPGPSLVVRSLFWSGGRVDQVPQGDWVGRRRLLPCFLFPYGPPRSWLPTMTGTFPCGRILVGSMQGPRPVWWPGAYSQ